MMNVNTGCIVLDTLHVSWRIKIAMLDVVRE